MWFRISGKRFFYTVSEPQTGREPQPVLTTDNGRFTVGRARLAPAMISTPGHRASRRRQREALPVWCNATGKQLQAARSNPPTTLPRLGLMPRRAKAVPLDATSAPVPANNKRYRGLTKLTVAGNRWFEFTSLQQTVRLSSAAAFEGREPGFRRGFARMAWRPRRQRRRDVLISLRRAAMSLSRRIPVPQWG